MKPLLLAALVALVGLCGCPDPAEVGHAPKKQLDDVRKKADAAGAKDAKRADDAAAVTE